MNVAPELRPLPLKSSARGVRPGMLVLLTPCQSLAGVRTVLCGQSHAWAINQTVVAPEIDGKPSPGPALAERLGIAAVAQWGRAIHDAYLEHAIALGRERNFAIIWKGNQHNADFLFRADPPYDLVPSAEPDCAVEDGAVLLAEAAVRAHFQPSLERLESVLTAVGHAPGLRRFVLGTPPPLHSAELIRRRMLESARYAARTHDAGVDAATVPINPASVRRKLWLVLQTLLADTAARLGAEFVPAPARSLDRHGCLDPRYSIGDITHATAGYGLLLLQDLAARLSGEPQGAPSDA